LASRSSAIPPHRAFGGIADPIRVLEAAGKVVARHGG
jgi:hypothetical protein